MSDQRTVAQVILAALAQYRGDDLERAESAFRGLSDAEMDAQYGESGLTRRQILDGYRMERAEVEAAERLVRESARLGKPYGDKP